MALFPHDFPETLSMPPDEELSAPVSELLVWWDAKKAKRRWKRTAEEPLMERIRAALEREKAKQ